MKKAAVIPAVLLAVLCSFSGCGKEKVEQAIAPLVSDEQTTEEIKEVQEEKDPVIPEIDASGRNSARCPDCGCKQEHKR